MAKKNTPNVGTLHITVDKDTRQIFVVVHDWEGVSPGMLAGLEYSIQKAIHQYHIANLTKERTEQIAADARALRKQSGDGRVDPRTSDIPN